MLFLFCLRVMPLIAPLVVAALIGAGVSLVTGAVNYYNQRQTNKTNAHIAAANNSMSYRMFEEGNEFNHNEAIDAFNREYEASKYSNQIKLMKEAGLNPAMMFGEGNVTSPANSPAASAGGVPSLATPTMQSPTFDFSSITDVAGSLAALAQAKKAGAETKSIEAMLNEQIKDLQLRNEYQEILNTYQGKKSATEIAKMMQDIEKQYVEIDNLIKEGKLTEAQTRLTNVQEEIGQEEKGLRKADRELREALSRKREEYTQNILNQQKAETKKTQQEGDATERTSRAQAGYYAEQARDLRETRQARIDNMRADARQKNALSAINEYDLDTRPNKFSASWHNFTNMCLETLSGTVSVKYMANELELIGQQIETARKNNDWYLVNQLMSNAKDIAIGLASVAVARKGFGGKSAGTTNGFTVTPMQ